MNITAFLGSPRKNGNTALLLREFLRGASENDGIKINSFSLQEKHILSCTACDYCKSSNECILNDDMQEIYPLIKEADVLVFATPVYWWSMTSQLKTLVDRLYALNMEKLKGKRAYLLMTYGGELPNSGPELVEKTFRDICDYIGIELEDVYGVCTDENIPVQENKKALEEIYQIGKNIM